MILVKKIYLSHIKLPVEEDTYVEFLNLRSVPIMERECSDDTVDIVQQVSTFCIILVINVSNLSRDIT
jgi:hypothetical protein